MAFGRSEPARTAARGPLILAKIVIASQVTVTEKVGTGSETEALRVTVARADGGKCQRCWVYTPQVGTHAAHPGLCDRCVEVV